jgi:hypothetical protein
MFVLMRRDSAFCSLGLVEPETLSLKAAFTRSGIG